MQMKGTSARGTAVRATPVRVAPQARVAAPSWELGVRYAAAYICTLLAIVAAQPKIDLAFAACLHGVTALGLPVSLACAAGV
jgi:hypothetical protein